MCALSCKPKHDNFGFVLYYKYITVTNFDDYRDAQLFLEDDPRQLSG